MIVLHECVCTNICNKLSVVNIHIIGIITENYSHNSTLRSLRKITEETKGIRINCGMVFNECNDENEWTVDT
jgi:hypothetical protein